MKKQIAEAVLKRADGRCEYCGAYCGEALILHHEHFRSRGGKDTPEDLMAVCFICHMKAHGIKVVY